MPPPESEIRAIRLARMKNLIESLERVCSDSAEQRPVPEAQTGDGSDMRGPQDRSPARLI